MQYQIMKNIFKWISYGSLLTTLAACAPGQDTSGHGGISGTLEQRVYDSECAGCHGSEGKGVQSEGTQPLTRTTYDVVQLVVDSERMINTYGSNCRGLGDGTVTDCANALAIFIENTFKLLPPTADASASSNVINNAPLTIAGDSPLDVSFDASASLPEGDATISTYLWDFDINSVDDIQQATRTATYRYENPGSYVAQLTITDSNGLTSTTTIVVRVDSNGNQAPVAILNTGAITTGLDNTPFQVNFDASASTDDGTLIYDWDYGDGNTQLNGNVTESHSYTVAGVYTARVTVTDQGALTSSATKTITVVSTVAFAATQYNTPCAGCHGANGDGNGNALRDLRDPWIDNDPTLLMKVEGMLNDAGKVNQNTRCMSNALDFDACADAMRDYIKDTFGT